MSIEDRIDGCDPEFKWLEKKILGRKIKYGWSLKLQHPCVEAIKKGTPLAALSLNPTVIAVVTAVAASLDTICNVGGHDGVEIMHVTVPTPNTIVLPL